MTTLSDTIRQTGEIDHQLATDLTDHAIYVTVIAFCVLVGLILTVLVLDDFRRRRAARNRAADEAEAERRRQRGVDEGFRQGWHG